MFWFVDRVVDHVVEHVVDDAGGVACDVADVAAVDAMQCR